MNKILAFGLFAAGFAFAPHAHAQQGGSTPLPLPTRAPTPGLSPFLLLNNNNGNNGFRGANAVDLYLGVNPEFQRRQFQQNAGAAIQGLERNAIQGPALGVPDLQPSLATTGHVAVFNNLGGYFNSTGVNKPSFVHLQGTAPPKRGR